jgi:hypothetical protein
MSASVSNHPSVAPVPPFGAETPLMDREERSKARRVPLVLGVNVTELEPHWIETIDAATD